MKHELSDGNVVDLSKIASVSVVRDMGADPNSIVYSKMSFTIHFKDQSSLEISRKYHYSDWAQAKKILEQDRQELLNKLREYKARA
ncbi:MAG: hypothetical protein PWP64_572 [Candidatus Cloacimonadota bacterium]|nr:hypothetical protein [Candidatus Cloacimonadota bacterium]